MPDATVLGPATISGGGTTPPAHGASFALGMSSPAVGIPPTAAIVSPSPGSSISANTPIVVDVTDDKDGIRRALLAISFPSIGQTDLAFDGTQFAGVYAGSTRTRITNGYRYGLVRSGGWPASPTFTAYVTDTDGLEAA